MYNKDYCMDLLKKYPDRIPCIIVSNDIELVKNKYLVPKNMKFNEFLFSVRKNIKINKEEALFFTINNQIPSSNTSIIEIYNNLKKDNGLLYINISKENTFG